MAHIGAFTRTANGYSGRLRNAHARCRTHPRSGQCWRRREGAGLSDLPSGESADGPEVGAGWKRTGEKAGDYVSLLIDDPVFTQPIRANLFQAEREGSVFNLLWNRPPKRDERA